MKTQVALKRLSHEVVEELYIPTGVLACADVVGQEEGFWKAQE